MAVQVSVNSIAGFLTGVRSVVRTSAGIPYVICYNGTNLQMFKGNSATPASFALQDAGNQPTKSIGYYFTYPEIVIDSSDIIHVTWCHCKSGVSGNYVEYTTFDTGTDTWSLPAEVVFSINSTQLSSRIDIDSSDIPHIAFWTVTMTGLPSRNFCLWYTNRIGGSWKTPVLLEGSLTDTSLDDANNVCLCITPDDIPVLAYRRNPRSYAVNTYCFSIGDANDLTSITRHLETTVKSHNGIPSIAINKNQVLYVAFYSDNNDDPQTGDGLTIWRHNHGDAWTVWSQDLPGYLSSTYPTNPEPCLVIDGVVLYVFWQKTYAGAPYERGQVATNDGSWNNTQLSTGNYFIQGSGKWATWVDNDSSGANRGIAGGRLEIDYVYMDTNSKPWFSTMAVLPQPVVEEDLHMIPELM